MVNISFYDEESFHGIKIPKVRAWYMNKDGSYLDRYLEKITNL
jgi:hypothetical protein